jgi:glycosyltransferase involved in cell wall biosynthesis
MKVAIYTICKNEEHNVHGWLGSIINGMEPHDPIVVCDTGSTDDTLKNFTGYDIGFPHRISIDPWRYDDAHNAALALVPADADVCIPLHLDERLEPGWRAALEAKWKVGICTKAYYTYNFSATYSFQQNRIHARKGYRWRHPAHEGIYPYGGAREVTVHIPELVITQRQDGKKDRSNTLHLLEMGVNEMPHDARMRHYLGREYMYRGNYNLALRQLGMYEGLMAGKSHPVEQAQNRECIETCRRMIDGRDIDLRTTPL